jgi:hypothetical protein
MLMLPRHRGYPIAKGKGFHGIMAVQINNLSSLRVGIW